MYIRDLADVATTEADLMTMIFYDTETTGKSTSFDQILQFAAIATDDDFRELGRFEIRSRLLPHVVPSAGAMRVTKTTVAQLLDAAQPTHYEMVRAIREQLMAWSPGLFLGYNSLLFDEHLLRQAFFQTLQPPYLTNTNGNSRTDVLRMVRAASLFAPEALSVPVDAEGRAVFKLEQIAPANGFDHANAHDALADVEATIHMARLVRVRAPNVWEAFQRFSVPVAVAEHLEREPVVCLSDYYGRHYSWLVTKIGSNEEIRTEHYVFDLGADIDQVAGLSDDQLIRRLARTPKPVRRVKGNGSPIIMPADAAPEIAVSRELGMDELRRRALLVGQDEQLCTRLIRAFEATVQPREPSAHVEEQIYDGFPQQADQQRMERFHEVPWEQRPALVEEFDDPRLTLLGRRLIHIECPDVLSEEQRAELDSILARRVSGVDEGAPWLSLPGAIDEVGKLIAEAAEADLELLREHQAYATQRLEAARQLLG